MCSFPQDTVRQDTLVSVLFKKVPAPEVNKLVYRHSQGFFCDFEDRINKNRKLNLNVGVGEQ